jgi:hypothetical protein
MVSMAPSLHPLSIFGELVRLCAQESEGWCTFSFGCMPSAHRSREHLVPYRKSFSRRHRLASRGMRSQEPCSVEPQRAGLHWDLRANSRWRSFRFGYCSPSLRIGRSFPRSALAVHESQLSRADSKAIPSVTRGSVSRHLTVHYSEFSARRLSSIARSAARAPLIS